MNPLEQQNNHMVEPAPGGINRDINNPLFSHTDISESSNLAKVRDILFGNQMRDVEKRFMRLEERLVKESANLREETIKRLDSLEMYIQKEVESIAARVKTEQAERDEAVQTLAESQKNITMSLEKKLTQFDEQTSNNQRELREQILKQSKSLQDDVRQKYDEILALLQRESQEIRHDKTDRSTLANLFTELAMRLNSQA